MRNTSTAKIETIPVKELQKLYNEKKAKTVPVLNKNYDYFSPEQYGKMLRLSTQTITAMCRGNGIEGAIKVNGQWRIPVRKSEPIE